ncbi:MAG: hypothetical protein JW862_12045 [Anaerolineales bacterium]|nr:hypothetical protein [Anaerolineales bacterium]
MKNQRWLFVVGVLALAAVLALVFQYLVYDLVITPLAYTWWLVKGFLQVVPELAYWWALVTMLLLAALRATFRRMGPEKMSGKPAAEQSGPVEQLAYHLERVGQGNYFKWFVAHRLGELAREILKRRTVNDVPPQHDLAGPEWSPPPAVQRYLETGLHTSFIQLPRRRFWFWKRPAKTPLDIQIDPVIDYLESQMEMKN